MQTLRFACCTKAKALYFAYLIWSATGCQNCRKKTSHAENNLLIVQEQYGLRSKHSVLGLVLVLTLCIEDAVKIKFNPEHDIAKAYPSVPRPELMDVFKKNQVFHPSF